MAVQICISLRFLSFSILGISRFEKCNKTLYGPQRKVQPQILFLLLDCSPITMLTMMTSRQASLRLLAVMRVNTIRICHLVVPSQEFFAPNDTVLFFCNCRMDGLLVYLLSVPESGELGQTILHVCL